MAPGTGGAGRPGAVPRSGSLGSGAAPDGSGFGGKGVGPFGTGGCLRGAGDTAADAPTGAGRSCWGEASRPGTGGGGREAFISARVGSAGPASCGGATFFNLPSCAAGLNAVDTGRSGWSACRSRLDLSPDGAGPPGVTCGAATGVRAGAWSWRAGTGGSWSCRGGGCGTCDRRSVSTRGGGFGGRRPPASWCLVWNSSYSARVRWM